MNRCKIKSSEYWSDYINKKDFFINKHKELIRSTEIINSHEDLINSSWILQKNYFQKVSACYSVGLEKSYIKEIFSEFIIIFFDFYKECSKNPGKNLVEYFLSYDKRVRYLALAVLLDSEKENIDKIVEAVDFWPGEDAIWEKMITYLGIANREPINSIQWPEAYESLWHCFICPEGERSDQLKKFLENWYKQMKMGGVAWIGSHKSKFDTYFGYWCFEAAAVAKILNIDDSALKNHPHYPYDLVHPEQEAKVSPS